MANSHEPHFFKPLLPGFHSGVTIPLGFFSKHIEGKTNQKTWKLRSDASDQTWKVIQEGWRLTGGWKDFTTAHDLRIGDIVIFKHEGDMVFHVTPFGPSCCDIDRNDHQHQLITRSSAALGDRIITCRRLRRRDGLRHQKLEEVYRRATRTPTTEQIQQIASKLRKYGRIESKNVFYWFQNHKARERERERAKQRRHQEDDKILTTFVNHFKTSRIFIIK
ncbi:hypothetical protein Bca4012_013603 [Brassica carinata]